MTFEKNRLQYQASIHASPCDCLKMKQNSVLFYNSRLLLFFFSSNKLTINIHKFQCKVTAMQWVTKCEHIVICILTIQTQVSMYQMDWTEKKKIFHKN